jgi:hypothetical protein
MILATVKENAHCKVGVSNSQFANYDLKCRRASREACDLLASCMALVQVDPLFSCFRCGESKPASDFTRNRFHKNGLQQRCRDCINRLYTEKQQIIAELKGARGCEVCHVKNPVVLEFDHIDPTTKSFNLCLGHTYSEKALRAEVEKCRVLCNNHHKLHTLNQRSAGLISNRTRLLQPETGVSRHCSRCRRDKDSSLFAGGKKQALGKQVWCKDCHADYQRASQTIIKAQLSAIKAERGCADCPEKDPRVLDFDHVRGKKSFNLCTATSMSPAVVAEIDKCDVVCGNCHRIRTSKRPKKTRARIIPRPLPSLS